ncbi:MAG: histidine phosphatase family protein, partial [Clostridia bacterium]|nr:histidine phosphatase family protein [Clostridia bacterium]
MGVNQEMDAKWTRSKGERTRLYIVRHGETDSNDKHRFIGKTDMPLNERGMQQAACLDEPMRAVNLDRIYSSPYLRTMMTAEHVRAGRDIEIIADKALCEIDCGEWEGLNREEIEARWPGMISIWQFEPEKLQMPGGESFQEVQERAVNAIVRIVHENRGRDIGITSHMLTIQLIMCRLLGIPIHEVWNMQRLENTSVTSIDIWGNGEFEIIRWGEDSHLPDALKNPYVKIAGFVQRDFKEAYDLGRVEGIYHFERFA